MLPAILTRRLCAERRAADGSRDGTKSTVTKDQSHCRISTKNRAHAEERELRQGPVILRPVPEYEQGVVPQEAYQFEERVLPSQLERAAILLQQRGFIGM